MKIQFIYRPKQGVSFHRLVNRFSYYPADIGDTIEMLEYGKDEGFINCDILVYSNFIDTSISELKEMKAKGMKIVVDIDDYWEVPSTNPSYFWLKKANYTQNTIEHMKLADVVLCTTLRLQDAIRKYNKNTIVIPNAFPYGQENYTDTNWVPNMEFTRFLHCAGVSHVDDVAMLSGKFQRIGTDPILNRTCRFILAGYEKAQQIQYFSQQDMKLGTNNYRVVEGKWGNWDKMASVFKKTNCSVILPAKDAIEYIEFYDHADVSIIPLMYNTFNSYKSVLKFAEAATRNIPVICSMVPPYSDELDVPGVLWVQHKDDWLKHIRQCSKDKEYCMDLGKQLGEYCREKYELTKWNEVVKQVFKSLIQ
jgi:hypothetical protein